MLRGLIENDKNSKDILRRRFYKWLLNIPIMK
jgi:hypothetical protein